MTGENCCVVRCGSCRRHKEIGIFKLPSKSNDENHQSKLISDNWRKAWLNEISKHRVADKTCRKQIEKGNVYTCEKDFNPEDIEIRNCSGMHLFNINLQLGRAMIDWSSKIFFEILWG